jgi:hypothetical protein
MKTHPPDKMRLLTEIVHQLIDKQVVTVINPAEALPGLYSYLFLRPKKRVISVPYLI